MPKSSLWSTTRRRSPSRTCSTYSSRPRQGPDVGTQYRSVILYTTEEQEEKVARYIEELSKNYGPPIVTEVKPLEKFFEAEKYHQRYFEKNPGQGYCQVVISPKVKNVKSKLGVS
jgi:peptide-methionine (S)-S-oxide reductase